MGGSIPSDFFHSDYNQYLYNLLCMQQGSKVAPLFDLVVLKSQVVELYVQLTQLFQRPSCLRCNVGQLHKPLCLWGGIGFLYFSSSVGIAKHHGRQHW